MIGQTAQNIAVVQGAESAVGQAALYLCRTNRAGAILVEIESTGHTRWRYQLKKSTFRFRVPPKAGEEQDND